MPRREERRKRNKAPKELRQAKKRTRALTKGALEAFNKRAKRVAQDRRESRSEIQRMIADERVKERHWRKEQQRQADESGVLEGALMGGMAGAKVGSLFPGYGTIIGGAVGALAGGLYGSGTGGKADVAGISPYAAGISNLAGQYAATQQGKERFAQMLDLYKNRGTGQAGQAGQAGQLPHPVFALGGQDAGGGVDGFYPFTGKPHDAEALAKRYKSDTWATSTLPYGSTTETFKRATNPDRTYISNDPNYPGSRQNFFDLIEAKAKAGTGSTT